MLLRQKIIKAGFFKRKSKASRMDIFACHVMAAIYVWAFCEN